MTDPAGFPGRHTTTTSVSQTNVQPEIRYDPSYMSTVPGILKIALVALNIIGFICIQAAGLSSLYSQGRYFCFVSGVGFWFTGILLLFYILHVCEKFYKIPWIQIEMIFNALWTIFYLFAASFACAVAISAYSAAAFFGFCAMVLYGYDAFLKFKAFRAGEIAQGSRTVVQQQQTTVSIS